jgi:hypothetical protein
VGNVARRAFHLHRATLSLSNTRFGVCVSGKSAVQTQLFSRICQAVSFGACGEREEEETVAGLYCANVHQSVCYRDLAERELSVCCQFVSISHSGSDEVLFLLFSSRSLSQPFGRSRNVDESGEAIMDGDAVPFGRGSVFRSVNDLRYLLSHPCFVLALLNVYVVVWLRFVGILKMGSLGTSCELSLSNLLFLFRAPCGSSASSETTCSSRSKDTETSLDSNANSLTLSV